LDDELQYDNTLPALEYVNADKLSEDEILLDDDEIVETVRLKHNAKIAQDNNDELIPNIFLTDALNCVEKLINFQYFPPKNESYKSEFMLQLSLDEFFVLH
ncbi:1881_t:CDS:2, partial [Funneliformis geosporum]